MLNFLVYMPYFRSQIMHSKDADITLYLNIKGGRMRCYEWTRKILNFIFNVLYLSLFFKVIMAVNRNKN
jgi:predicted peroxiredoxin